MPETVPLRPLDETTLKRMIRYAATAWARRASCGQLTVDDTSAAAGCLLEKSRVPMRLTGSPTEAALRSR